MRRVLAGVTAAVVATAVSGLVLLGGGTSSSAAVPTIQLTLTAPEGQTHVKDNPDKVRFNGQVTPGAAITAAAIHFYNAQGVEFRSKMNVYNDLNYDRPSGTIAGSERTLPGMAGGHEGYIVFRVTAVDTEDGQQATGDSNRLLIDLIPPHITTTRLTAPNTVEVVFSEPVHLPTQEDNQADWGVEVARVNDPVQNREEIVYGTPTAVSRTGSIITLTTAKTYDEDDTPEVRYNAGAGLLPDRETYHDNSANNPFDTGSYQTSEDKIAPRNPVISHVEGTQGTSGVGKSPTPTFRFTNLRAGHHVELYRDVNGDGVFQRPGDAFAGETVASDSGTQITISELVSDGTYTFFAIARDNALCDPPDDGTGNEALCPNRSSADSAAKATYVLDRVVPTIQFAAVTDVAEVTVGFTEVVFGANNISNWEVSGGTVTAVTGSGDRRTLTVLGAQPGANITYTPGNYADAAGNGVPSFFNLLLDNLPPLVDVSDPTGTIHAGATTYDFKGTAQRADQVEIFRNNDGNTTPDSTDPIATASVGGDGSWATSVPLLADQSNVFIVRGVRFATETPPRPQIIGPNEEVNAEIIQDSQNPTLDLSALPGTAFRGEAPLGVAINWSANDANFPTSPGPIDVEYSLDGGETWAFAENIDGQLGDGIQNDPPFEWFPPLANTKEAQIRVTASDLAGRSTSKTSPLFEIDSTRPNFLAVILNARVVELTFSEPVSGVFTPAEWEINEQTVGQIEPAGPATGRTSATLTLAPTANDIDPNQTNLIKYEPLVPARISEQDLRDHVGNPIVADSTGGGAHHGGGGNGGTTVVASAVSACTVFGTDGADVITGTEGPDIICPSNGNDIIHALGDNDIILPGLGAKTIDGGAGNDEINGGPEIDTLTGDSGHDLLVGGIGTDSLVGGDGDDMILGGDGVDSIDGGAGLDVLEGEAGNDDLAGGTGVDIISGGSEDDSLSGGDGNDRLSGDAGDDSLRGGSGDDALDGGDGNDVLEGEAGNDELLGQAGRDQLLANGGIDRIDGGDGNDRIDGGDSNDRLDGGAGDDRIDGGDGNDNLTGAAGKDTLQGQAGNDKLIGSDDNDILNGGSDRDQLSGDAGRDKLYGESSRDKLLGGSGRDRLDGGDGVDYCNGGTAPDSKLGCEGGPNK